MPKSRDVAYLCQIVASFLLLPFELRSRIGHAQTSASQHIPREGSLSDGLLLLFHPDVAEYPDWLK